MMPTTIVDKIKRNPKTILSVFANLLRLIEQSLIHLLEIRDWLFVMQSKIERLMVVKPTN